MNNNVNKDFICLPDTTLPRVVVVGGGFAGISIVKQLRNKPVQVILIDRNNFHQFQPLLYQVATCGLEPDGIVFPLRKLINGYQNVFFRMAEVVNISSQENIIETSIGKLHYDYLIIATGSVTNYFGLKDIENHSIGMKDIREALDIRSLILQNLEEAVITCDMELRDALTNFLIVGGGPAGVEMAGAIAEFRRYILPKDYTELHVRDMQIYLLEAGDQLLPAMSSGSSTKSLKYLESMGVDVRLNEAAKSYNGTTLTTSTGSTMKARTVIWTAGVKGAFPAGLLHENNISSGRLRVDAFNRIIGLDNVFALGDAAAMITEEFPSGHPMVAQPAIQQGRLLGKNIIALVRGKDLKPFKYKDKGSLATVGKRRAVADLIRMHFGGYLAWLLWSIVHLMSIAGFRNRLLVGMNWMWSYFTYEKGNRLIIRRKDFNVKHNQ